MSAQEPEFHPLEVAMPAAFLIVAYLTLFASISPLLSKAKNGRALHDRVQVLMKRGNFAQALTYISELTQQFPSNHVYWNQRADIHHRLSQFADEAKALEQVLIYSSVPDEVCPRLGQAYEKVGDNSAMLNAHRKCLQLEPNNSDFHLYMGLALERVEKYDEAQTEYQSCLQRSPRYLDCSTGLARVHLQKNQAQASHEILTAPMTVEKVEKDSDALLTRASARRQLGLFDLAKKDLQTALALSPNYGDLWEELSLIEQHQGNKNEALKALRKGAELKPDSKKIKTAIQTLEGEP